MSARATCTGTKLGSADAARTILHAVRCGLLPLLVQRLSPEERLAISAGDIFVWEEKSLGSDSGIERWTDSKRWSASRVKDAFLLYNEKLEPNESFVAVGSELKIAPQRDCLVKQTFTSHVTTARGRRKWHLIAYYTESSLSTLRTIDDFPLLRGLDVPHDKYPSARAVKGRPENIFNPPRNASNRPITPQYHFYALPPPPSQPSQPSNVSHGHRARGRERATGPYHSPVPDSRVQFPMMTSKARRQRALTSASDMSAESADSGYQSASQSDAAAGRSRSSTFTVAAYANHVPLPDTDHSVLEPAARDDDGYLAPEIHAPTAIKHHSGWFGREMEYAAEHTPSTSLQARVHQGNSSFLAPPSPSNGYRTQVPRHLHHQPQPQQQPTHTHHSTTHRDTYPRFDYPDHKNPGSIPSLPKILEQHYDYDSKNRDQHGPPRLLPPPLPSPRVPQHRWGPTLPDPRRMGPPTRFVSRALTDQHMLNSILNASP
ncbi:hypothetical protein CYLTODRAFT_396264 [Cylindrobasidium torrendii FP15055 ss-10]|uniref:cAMP-independent regulatory protein pac2 n=1 Tax=Cylindrobasidium torrendii FP15055 ss-10 TaxID=1314674 RepID=A0A0D7BCD6_9AGAR|nr:hypothetical protein CYLTODRAFT_396264 [Cylindrobasidium torrendii FP15055 ss-10]